MLRYAAYLFVFFSLVAGGLTPAHAAKRVALVLQNELKRVDCEPGKVDGKLSKLERTGDQCVKKSCRAGQKHITQGQCVKVAEKKKPAPKPKKKKKFKKFKKTGQPCPTPGSHDWGDHTHVYNLLGECVNEG